MYTPLGIKTDYSLLKSLIRINELISYAKKYHFNILGILDDNLNGSHIFYEACIKNNIKPIIGLDIIIDECRMYLYPQNYDGLVNLFKLTSDKLNKIITISDLSTYSSSVICVLPSESYNIYENVSKIYDNVFLSFKNSEEELSAKIITNNVIYINLINSLTEESSKYVNYLTMIDENKKLGEYALLDYKDNVLKPLNYNTSALTDLIDIEIHQNTKYIPHFSEEIPNSNEYLRTLAIKGLTKRLNGNIPEEYKKRLNYELDVIESMGFTDYFLIVFDYVRFAVKSGILVGVGRGSAAGSLVSYSLGITWIDPLKYDLLFERFLNPERVTMPDIDIDFEDERKDEVVDYVKSRYGNNRVARIMTFGTMTAKEVLRSVGKINNVDESSLNNLLKNVNSKLSLKDNLSDTVKKILHNNSELTKVYKESFNLEGIKKHIGTHAAGVIICSTDLTNLIPIIKSGDEYLTGYTSTELESMGLLKMDFLSLKNLTIMNNILKYIEESTGKRLSINEIPLDDPAVYRMFASADTVGIFQFESPGMKNFLRKQKPTCFADLVMSMAIFRPGPMQSIDIYIDRKNNHAQIEYVDESLKPILESTYGILIYQEQVMEIFRFMASYSYAEADLIRRAISKKKLHIIEDEKIKFIKQSMKNGYTEETANKVYELIVKFADYGFNKSHSVAYSMIAYQMAYLKVHYREFYYINLLNMNIGGETKTKEYIDEAKSTGITILKPSINLSKKEYSKEEKGIRLPLRVIKGVGTSSSDAIIDKRGDKPFTDFFDFVARCYGFNVNKKTIEALIYAGVFDEYGYNRATLIKNIDAAVMYGDLISNLDASLVSKPELEIVTEFTELDLMNKELELFGYYVSTHPASKFPNVAKIINIDDYFDKFIETVVLINRVKVVKTKNNDDMAFIAGSDETGSLDFTIFPKQISKIAEIKTGDLVRVKGKVERRFDKYQIIISDIEKV